jgi:hypothetical protein
MSAEVDRLCAEIASAASEAEIAAIVTRVNELTSSWPPRRREQQIAVLTDAISERRGAFRESGNET